MAEAAEICAKHGVKLFLEHKNSEPAMKIFMRNIGMTLHVIHTLRAQGITNVKVNMDWQHLMMNGESLGEYAALLAAEGLLGHQHANSGWGTFDDDNMVGATAFMETLELALELRRAGYGENGERLGFDLYPYTEDAVAAVKRRCCSGASSTTSPAKIDDAALREAQTRKDAVRAYELVYAALGARRGGTPVPHGPLPVAPGSIAGLLQSPASPAPADNSDEAQAGRCPRHAAHLRGDSQRASRPEAGFRREATRGARDSHAKEGVRGGTMSTRARRAGRRHDRSQGARDVARRRGRARAPSAGTRSPRRGPAGPSRIPEDWWRAAEAALAEAVGGREIAGIGLSGQMHGLVVLDEAERVMRPGDPLERPAHRSRVRRDRGARRARPADRADRKPRADRLHRAEAPLAAPARARGVRAHRARDAAEGLRPAAG